MIKVPRENDKYKIGDAILDNVMFGTQDGAQRSL